MSVKIIPIRSAAWLLALAVILAGCSPAGPRALFRGKKYLDAGDYAAAVAQFKTATTLLATNAAAWNYYGVALQRAGQPDEAANAYLRALNLDRDLLEARLNLGILHLEQNQPDAAKTELTAYTLRRPNDPEGWLQLGSAQLKLGEIVPAERSFSTVLALKTNVAAAYNGLGLARVQRGRPREAAQFFAAAVQAQADFAPALLNLAAVNQEYLHDNKAALENYHAYLALTPRPADWDEVNAIATTLEQTSIAAGQNPNPPAAPPAAAVTAAAPAVKPVTAAPVTAPEPKPQPKTTTVASVHPTQSPRAQSARPVAAARPPATPPPQTVRVAPEPQIVTTPNPRATATTAEPLVVTTPEPAAKPGFLRRLFGSSKTETKYADNGVTPLPDERTQPAKPVVLIPPAPVNFPRYNYLSPRKPAAGDRRAAGGAFTQARLAEQEEKWAAALQGYRTAAELDPSWFEAQYNAGVIAQRLQNYDAALASYEQALALEPDSVNARYNFALALRGAGYAPDAANELKKILAAHPDEVRAHLALANLCAQELRDPAQARVHYQKVLALDPANPRANDIRFWLVANPG
jgi:tetratricopeptide (TPR) repeat protein